MSKMVYFVLIACFVVKLSSQKKFLMKCAFLHSVNAQKYNKTREIRVHVIFCGSQSAIKGFDPLTLIQVGKVRSDPRGKFDPLQTVKDGVMKLCNCFYLFMRKTTVYTFSRWEAQIKSELIKNRKKQLKMAHYRKISKTLAI